VSNAKRRAVVKLSGEAFMGNREFGIDPSTVNAFADQLGRASADGFEVAVVVGGGNFWRGATVAETGMDRGTADYAGMLATIMNALALQDTLENQGAFARVMSAIRINELCEDYLRRRAIRHLEKGRVVIFAGGTGNPYFTTDTAAVLRALELDANCLIKATKVDGIYDKDPHQHDDATKFETIGYTEIIGRRLAVMDMTAFTMCQENKLPIIVLDLLSGGSIKKAVLGKTDGTLVESD